MNLRNILIGAASAVALVTLAGAASAQTSSTATATASATIVAPSSVSANRNLAFGTIAKPSGAQASTVTVASAVSGSATPSIAGGNAYVTSTGQASSAQFHITGTAGTTFYIDPPALTFTGVTAGSGVLGAYAASAPLLASTSATLGTGSANTVTLTSGVDDIYVGGSIVLTSSTPVNTYNGTLALTVNFQ